MADNPSPCIIRAEQAHAQQQTFSHPWNSASEISGVMLARMTGLKRTGVSLARIAPGKESFVYHSHMFEEEWLYILSGRAVVEIDGQEYEVGSGDFIGFPAPSVAHHLRNPFEAELVYLMGGENKEVEIADFPKLGRRMVRHGSEVQIYRIGDAKPFGPLDE